jgi:hypothetical protein
MTAHPEAILQKKPASGLMTIRSEAVDPIGRGQLTLTLQV